MDEVSLFETAKEDDKNEDNDWTSSSISRFRTRQHDLGKSARTVTQYFEATARLTSRTTLGRRTSGWISKKWRTAF